MNNNTNDCINPNLDWYKAVSKNFTVPPRCPYANLNRCPNFYLSCSLLSKYGVSTTIDGKTDNKLFRKWKKTDFWPYTIEYEPGIFEIDNKIAGYNNFCPEVLFKYFGYFACNLHFYTDETDKQLVENKLKKEKVTIHDWRWSFRSLTQKHYTDCHLYSQLLNYQRQNSEDIFELKPNFYGIGINLKALKKKIFKK